MVLPGFAGPAYESQSRIAAGEQCINLYPERVESPSGKNQVALYGCPGFSSFATLADSPGRGIFGQGGRLFAVFGGTLAEISSAGVVTVRGAVANDGLPAQLVTNGDGGDELFVVAGGTGYIFELDTNTFQGQVVANVDFAGQIDGFFVALDSDSSTLRISESLDGQTWSATQIAQRTAASDPWTAMVVARREIFFLGERSGEVWYNAGLSPFPFAQRAGAFFEVGTGAPRSVASFGGTMAWLGQTQTGGLRVYWLNGYSPNRISNHAVEWALLRYRDSDGVEDAVGWSYEMKGHDFYVLEFPTTGRTWVYDATLDAWHERGRWDSVNNVFTRYRARFATEFYDRTLVCDNNGTTIQALSPTVYTDLGGSVLRRVRRAPSPPAEQKRVIYDYFELEAQRGVGLATGQGSDPLVTLRTSDDGGQTWPSSRTRSLGALGAYSQRIRWDRCGAARDRRWEISVTDPVNVALINAYIGARPCAN